MTRRSRRVPPLPPEIADMVPKVGERPAWVNWVQRTVSDDVVRELLQLRHEQRGLGAVWRRHVETIRNRERLLASIAWADAEGWFLIVATHAWRDLSRAVDRCREQAARLGGEGTRDEAERIVALSLYREQERERPGTGQAALAGLWTLALAGPQATGEIVGRANASYERAAEIRFSIWLIGEAYPHLRGDEIQRQISNDVMERLTIGDDVRRVLRMTTPGVDPSSGPSELFDLAPDWLESGEGWAVLAEALDGNLGLVRRAAGAARYSERDSAIARRPDHLPLDETRDEARDDENDKVERWRQTMIDAAPPEHRELVRRKLAGFTFRELAEIFGDDGNTIATRWRRLLRRLRPKLEEG
jgi:hypothetical protein